MLYFCISIVSFDFSFSIFSRGGEEGGGRREGVVGWCVWGGERGGEGRRGEEREGGKEEERRWNSAVGEGESGRTDKANSRQHEHGRLGERETWRTRKWAISRTGEQTAFSKHGPLHTGLKPSRANQCVHHVVKHTSAFSR